MSTLSLNRVSDVDATEPRWKWLYKIAGVSALLTFIIIPIQAYVFIAWPPPTTAIDYFAVFQSSPLIGLLNLDLLLMIDNVLLILVFLGLYAALRRTSPTFATIATAVGLIGIAALFASNTSVDMLTLSNGYAAATTEAQRAAYLAAGEAALASYTGTAFQLSYILGSTAGIIISAVMLRSKSFGKVAGCMGIASNVIGFGIFLPEIGVYVSLISVVPFLAIWYILVGVKFLKLGRSRAVWQTDLGY